MGSCISICMNYGSKIKNNQDEMIKTIEFNNSIFNEKPVEDIDFNKDFEFC